MTTILYWSNQSLQGVLSEINYTMKWVEDKALRTNMTVIISNFFYKFILITIPSFKCLDIFLVQGPLIAHKDF